MATGNITVHLRANTHFVKPVAWLLYPLVLMRLLSVDRAVSIAMRFARAEASLEGWGGD